MSSGNNSKSFIDNLLAEIEICLNLRSGSLHVKDANVENGNPGLLLSNIVFQAIGDRNGQEPLTVRQKADYRQWFEYVSTYGHLLQNNTSAHQVLKELNSILALKSFLASSSSQTVIDAVFYGILHKIMSNISFHEKEQYVHLSRWFNTVQMDLTVRRERSVVNFSRTALYT